MAGYLCGGGPSPSPRAWKGGLGAQIEQGTTCTLEKRDLNPPLRRRKAAETGFHRTKGVQKGCRGF